MGLHFHLRDAAARGPRKRRAKLRRRLRPIVQNARAELAYKTALLSLVRRCTAAVERVLPSLKAKWPEPGAADGLSRARDADVPAEVLAAIKRASRTLGGLDKWAKRMVGLAVEANRDNVDRRLAGEIQRVIGIDVSGILRANTPLLSSMRVATKDNVALIRTIPKQHFDRVTKTVTEGWTAGARWESLVKQIARDGSVTENRARLIARDQTAKMNSAFNQERQQQVGIEEYEWSTSRDERVRPEHVDMDGKTCRWDDPPIVEDEPVHPGEAVNCRCVALPIVDVNALAAEAAGYAEEEMEAA